MLKSARQQILIIEDDRDIASLIELHLRDAGYDAHVARDGEDGLRQALHRAPDLIVLDLSLPEVDGLEVCRRLRAQPSYPLVLMLTARSSEFDRVLGLEMGADDYLTKPFSVRELLARVKALLRRADALSQGPASGVAEEKIEAIQCGPLMIDAQKRSVVLFGKNVALTAKEFDLLFLLANHPGRVYTRAQLLDLIWGLGYEGYEHTVNSHINRLRAKIERQPARPRFLLTAWGVGYKFAERDQWSVAA